ncbi:MAG: GNAT family N-acetyltransferase [Actinobacteria bacterium]|uniref:GNAT family N-acetyltransferase n=1 Tax=Propionicimonas sp. T2.31MG-18 TaxID=3157620 RepID=UPI0035ECDDDC|nr:GNAT family N-acetyltransferase [Actinomycetota bacterium]
MSARILTTWDAGTARRLVAEDPVANVFVGSRLDAGVLNPGAPGVLWGWPGDHPSALLHSGANLVPVVTDSEALPAFVEAVGRRRTCQSIVGPSWFALPFWRALGERWGKSYSQVREVRPRQPVMAITDSPAVPADPRVRPITAADFDSYFAASVAMYTEEVGADPLAGGDTSYRSYCRWLVDSGRAFGIVEGGRVVFKSDIGAASGPVAQIQGVWLDPSLRGRGLSEPAVAAVTEYVLAEYPTACLYVNDFNIRAIRCYERVGYRQSGEFATVLF